MSDSRLRELERRWKETESVEDEAAYLRERLRVGGLEQEMLELAAHLGSPAAIAIVGESEKSHPDDLALWVYSLKSWEKQVAVRAASACAELVVPMLNPVIPQEVDPQLKITATQKCLQNPCPDISLFTDDKPDADKMADVHRQGIAIFHSLGVRTLATLAAEASNAESAAQQASWAAASAQRALPEDINVRQAIQEQLIPWALGYSDPVCERVEARTANPPRT